MKNLFTKITLSLILCSSLLACGSGSETPDLADSSQSQTAPAQTQAPALATPQLGLSSSLNDIQSSLNLIGKFEVLPPPTTDNPSPAALRSQDLEIKYVPVDANNPQAGTTLQIIPAEGLHLDALAVGDFIFKITLSHRSQTQGDIVIASIETPVTIVNGQDAAVSFASATWRYDFDDDADGYANVTELMNGVWAVPAQSASRNPVSEWQPAPTDPKDPASHPGHVMVLNAGIIATLSPDSNGNARIVGDAHSVQSGVLIRVEHLDASGNEKGVYTFYARLDGSFDYSVPNSVQGDRIRISTLSLPSLAENPQFTSLSPDLSGDLAEVDKGISFKPVEVKFCTSVNPRNAYAEVGYIEISGTGFGSSVRDNEVLFPPFIDSKGIASSEVLIKTQSSSLTTLLVKIPKEAVSGYPQLHNKYSGPGKDSFGQCGDNQGIVVLQKNQNNDLLPDLFPILVKAPYVALAGEDFILNYAVVNQGSEDYDQGVPLEYYFTDDPAPVTLRRDLAAYPDSVFSDVQPQTASLSSSLHPLSSGAFAGLRSAHVSLLRSDGTTPQGKDHFFKINVDPIHIVIGGSAYGVLDELDNHNNILATEKPSFIHNLHLQLFGTNNDLISQNTASIGLDATAFRLENAGSTSYSSLPTGTVYEFNLLKENSLTLNLGKVKNAGSYPLAKTGTGLSAVYSNSDNDDPLNMRGTYYQSLLQLAGQMDEANGKVDLDEPAAQALIDQASHLNNQVYPVRIRTLYSRDCNLLTNNSADTQDIELRGAEFCQNRLEAGQEVAIPPLVFPINNYQIVEGPACLFVLAEAIKTDSQATGRESFCTASDKTPLLKDGVYQTLNDFKNADNVLKIPLYAKAVDLVVDVLNFAGTTTPTTRSFNLGDAISLDYEVRNQGTLATSGTSTLKLNLKRADHSGADLYSLITQPALVPPLGISDADSHQSVSAFPFNFTAASIAAWDNIPTGDVAIEAEIDPVSHEKPVGDYYEGTHENNNITYLPIRLVAPDLRIYGIGGDTLSACSSATCDNQIHPVNDSFTIDVYIKNDGDGPVNRPFYVRVGDGTADACVYSDNILVSSTSDSLTINPGQILRVPVAVRVRNNVVRCASTDSNSHAHRALQIFVDTNSSQPWGNIVEKNHLSVQDAEANNTQIGSQLSSLSGTITGPTLVGTDSFREIPAVTSAGLQVSYEVPFVDLSVDRVLAPTVSGHLLSDTDYPVSYHVTNHGNISSGRVNIRYQLVPTGTIFTGSTPLDLPGSTSIESIVVGQDLSRSTDTLHIPSGCPGACLNPNQEYQLKVIASVERGDDDPTPANNSSSAAFKVRHYDLEVVEGTVSLYPAASETALTSGAEILKNQSYEVHFQATKSGTEEALSVPYQIVLTRAGAADIALSVLDGSGIPIASPSFDFRTNDPVSESVRVKIPALNGTTALDESLPYAIKVVLNSTRVEGEELTSTNNQRTSTELFNVKHIELQADGGPTV
ncbi:MAG: hypothetical protein HQM15_08960 [Deltaproteobacteria bacterium]|nr:hypothetical protein [Deltaproteobacteria bacterium]